MTTSISARIRRALLGLALGLSALFAVLALLLLYVTEDGIFANQLRAEQAALEQQAAPERARWQPSGRQMHIYWSRDDLPGPQRAIVGDRPGVYEHFDGPVAWFILSGTLPASGREYFITYDVSELLAVRRSRPAIGALFGAGVAIVAVAAMLVALYLANLTLRPLRTLTHGLASGSTEELPPNFAERFERDEIGVLAAALAAALERARASARREFEFNQGMSHELRSPIQVAKSASELLQLAGGNAADPAASAPLERLDRALRQMENLTEAFLWLAGSHAAGGKTSNAGAETEKLVRDHEYLLQGRTVQIQVEQDDLSYGIPPAVFAVAVGNLLRNAIQHSDTGPVRCTFSRERITVHNRAADKSRQRETAGFGVGLEIVRRICQRQGWSLTLAGTADDGVLAVIEVDKHRREPP